MFLMGLLLSIGSVLGDKGLYLPPSNTYDAGYMPPINQNYLPELLPPQRRPIYGPPGFNQFYMPMHYFPIAAYGTPPNNPSFHTYYPIELTTQSPDAISITTADPNIPSSTTASPGYRYNPAVTCGPLPYPPASTTQTPAPSSTITTSPSEQTTIGSTPSSTEVPTTTPTVSSVSPDSSPSTTSASTTSTSTMPATGGILG